VTGEGLNPLTSIQVPTDSSQAAMGSMASMVMPEDCSLCLNRVAKFAANSSCAPPTPRRLGSCPTKRPANASRVTSSTAWATSGLSTSSRCWIVVAVNGRDPARPNSFLIAGWGNRVAPPNRFDSPASTLGLVLSGGLCRQGPPASPDRRDGQLRGDQRHRVLVDKPAMGQLVERCLLRRWFDCEPRRLERDLPLREYERVHAVIDRPGRGFSCPPRQ